MSSMMVSSVGMTDATATEPEIRAVLESLVRALRPALIVETGSYLGYTTETLGVTADSYGGKVISCEPNYEHMVQAARRCTGLPVWIRNQPSSDVEEVEQADFLFLDSDYKYREEEIRRAKPGAVIVIHDAFKSYDPNIAPLAPLIEQMGGLCFRCGIDGRGFGILVKT